MEARIEKQEQESIQVNKKRILMNALLLVSLLVWVVPTIRSISRLKRFALMQVTEQPP